MLSKEAERKRLLDRLTKLPPRHALLSDLVAGRAEIIRTLSVPYDEAGRRAMRQLLALPAPPDAVFAYNDETALNAMLACAEAGVRVPEDVRFVGYDDIAAAARSKPALSTIRVDKEARVCRPARLEAEGLVEIRDGIWHVKNRK